MTTLHLKILLIQERLFIQTFQLKKFINTINQISTYNKIAIKKIKILNKKYKQTCSFQTRNIPHLGHEKIIEQLLERFDHVVINPLIGPKKKRRCKI